jgi:protein TonB
VHRLVSEVTTTNQLIAPKMIPHGIEHVVETAPPPPVPVDAKGNAVLSSLLGSGPAAPPPPPPPPAAAPVVEGGNVVAANCISCPAPQYPAIARAAHVQGAVVLHAIIGKDGVIKQLEVVSGNAMLQGAALQAVRNWRYHPLLLNNEAMEVDTQITVNFDLNGE